MATSQPQLDPNALRNLAITLGNPQAPPGPMALPQDTSTPNLGITTPPPVFGPQGQLAGQVAPRGTLLGDKQERTRELGSKAGVDQIYGRISGSGFGQAHPVLGKILGGLAQGVAKAGDIGLSAVAPALAINLPGTEYHHAAQINALNKQIGSEEGEQEKEGLTQEAQARTGLLNTQTEELPGKTQSEEALQDAQIVNLLHPQAKTDFEVWRQQNPNNPVEDWLREQAAAKNQKPDTPEQQFIDEFTKKNPNGTIADAVHAYAAATQKPERGPTLIQQESGVDRIAGRLAKPYDEGYKQGNATLGRIQQTLHSVDAGYVGQGLAIPELLTSLVSGQGTGVRITQPELNAITAARGIKGDAESWFNAMAGKGKLTDTDKAEIKAVLAEAQKRLEAKTKIHSDALDSINGAESRADVIKADRLARQQLNDLEKTGHYTGQQITLKDGSVKTVTAVHPDGSFDAN